MYPQSHFLFTFLIAEIFVKLNIFNHYTALLTALIALLIDTDHFIYYSIKHKDLSLKHAWNTAVSGRMKERTFIHFRLGFIITTAIIILLYFINPTISLILLIAYFTHMFLDYTHLNILKVKGKYTEKIEGFTIKISKFEVWFDILLIIIIILLILL